MAKKDLSLSKDKKAMGVAGGIADYYGADPTWVRIAAIFVIVLTGIIPGLIIYFLVGTALKHGKKDGK